jgi:hypothetical protein
VTLVDQTAGGTTGAINIPPEECRVMDVAERENRVLADGDGPTVTSQYMARKS